MNSLKINNKESPSIWSNIFFLIPFFIAFSQGRIVLSILIILVILGSSTYHIFKKPGADWWWRVRDRTSLQTSLLYADTLFASSLAIYNLILFGDAEFPIEFWVAAVLAVPAFILYWDTSKKYPIYHSAWHFLTAIITSLALLA